MAWRVVLGTAFLVILVPLQPALGRPYRVGSG
jgi:hypothetical protein